MKSVIDSGGFPLIERQSLGFARRCRQKPLGIVAARATLQHGDFHSKSLFFMESAHCRGVRTQVASSDLSDKVQS